MFRRGEILVFSSCVVRLRVVTYTDLQGEIVVVDLTAEDETPSQREVVAMPVDLGIEVLVQASTLLKTDQFRRCVICGITSTTRR